MKLIGRHRPTPAMGIALAALVVALGGVAFATIPDSNGTVHACYQKRSGDLRVVESSDECRPSRERAVDLSAGGAGAGSGIVARVRSTGPVPVNANIVPIPLAGNTWTQGAADTNELFLETTVSIPPADGCALTRVVFFVDGQELTAFQYGGGGRFGGVFRLQSFLLDPGDPTEHTVTARTETDGLGTSCGAVIESVRINVAATS
jgi:hypothetical protein